ncbi:MAG: hypothetical protein PVG44_13075 [Desulfobacterales bacterium]|jgi:hypothetical protein
MKSKINILISSLILAALVVTSGCGRDSDAVVVDFTKTVAVVRYFVIPDRNVPPGLKTTPKLLMSY